MASPQLELSRLDREHLYCMVAVAARWLKVVTTVVCTLVSTLVSTLVTTVVCTVTKVT